MKTYNEMYGARIGEAKTADDVKRLWQDILTECKADGVSEETTRANLRYMLSHYGTSERNLWYENLPPEAKSSDMA